MANRLSHSLNKIESHTHAIKAQDTDENLVSKNGEQIEEGDHVYTRIRGGRHEGDVSFYLDTTITTPAPYVYLVVDWGAWNDIQVDKTVTSKDEADAESVKHPPKVLFTDQKGKDVAHNPGTLDVTEKAQQGQ